MMLDFQQKRKVKIFLYNKVTISVLALVFLIVLHSTWVVYRKKVESEEMMRISVKNVEILRSRSEDLTEKIERLATEKGIEEEVRSRFNVVRGDENVVIVVQSGSGTTTIAETRSFWFKIKSFFKSFF